MIEKGTTLKSSKYGDFVTTWNTDITTGDPYLITIRTDRNFEYEYDVDWNNDNVFDNTAINGDITHHYEDAGLHTIRIRGKFPHFIASLEDDFHTDSNSTKLLSVDQWGLIKWESMAYSFSGCKNMEILARDRPLLDDVLSCEFMFMNCQSIVSNEPMNYWNVSNVSNMEAMFYRAFLFQQNLNHWNVSNVSNMVGMFEQAESFNKPLNNWNVSNVSNMEGMFKAAIRFNQPLKDWNVSNVTNMRGLFAYAVSFKQNIGNWKVLSLNDATAMFLNVDLNTTGTTTNYDSLLIGWNGGNLLQNVPFNGGNSKYCLGATARQNMISSDSWSIIDGGIDIGCENTFVTTWKTYNVGITNNTSIRIPTLSGETYNYDVDWDNDGNWDVSNVTGDFTHDFGIAGTYTIRIRGSFPRIYFTNHWESDSRKILSVDNWGSIQWNSMESAFRSCRYLSINDSQNAPDLSQVTSMSKMFYNCENLSESTAVFNDWDVSNVTDMSGLFQGVLNFNQDLNNWVTSNVTSLEYTFSHGTFNGNISSWDTSNVINMRSVFDHNYMFNQDLSNWNVANVTTMRQMFAGCLVFNQNIGNWNVSNVLNMNGMFNGATNFKQDLSLWNIENVTSLQVIFGGVDLNNQGSTNNYDNLLISWSNQNIHSNLRFYGGYSKYCLGATARQNMIDNNNWSIIDGGLNCIPRPVTNKTKTSKEKEIKLFTLFPNPTTSNLNITTNNVINSSINIHIYNTIGSLILSTNFYFEKDNKKSIDVSNLEKGSYIIKISTKNSTQSSVFFKQ